MGGHATFSVTLSWKATPGCCLSFVFQATERNGQQLESSPERRPVDTGGIGLACTL